MTETHNVRHITYFAEDGSYGDATGLVMIDTTDWTDEDWDAIYSARDWEIATIAREIATSKMETD